MNEINKNDLLKLKLKADFKKSWDEMRDGKTTEEFVSDRLANAIVSLIVSTSLARSIMRIRNKGVTFWNLARLISSGIGAIAWAGNRTYRTIQVAKKNDAKPKTNKIQSIDISKLPVR